MSRLCISLPGPNLNDLDVQVHRAAALADLVEFRWDLYEPIEPKDRARLESMVEVVPEIATYHNFEETPENLEEIYQTLEGNFVKMATKANSILDSLRMLELVQRHDNLVGLCMGELGEVTRLLAPVVGAPWTYASLERGTEVAPGQLPASELGEIYHYSKLSPKTQVLGLIGDPISHSEGHEFHNQHFRENGIDAVYARFLVKPGEVQQFLKQVQCLPILGLSVTMPLKERVIEGEIVNTLAFRDGKWEGCNTDGPGALDVLGDVRGQTMVIVGAGGAGKAIAAEAERRGAQVRIHNRTRAGKYGSLGQLGEYEILVQCTPVEMPIPESQIIPGTLVLDIINRETKLLQVARKKGCRVVHGRSMFVKQGRRQHDFWFDRSTV